MEPTMQTLRPMAAVVESVEEVGTFMQKKEFSCINVTIPYKTTVIPYLDEI
ncbi:MAG: hypothetical protein IKA42_03205, partial [Clostridia bacterium]|nr:hypothetical protein [Clostridia bacterium]